MSICVSYSGINKRSNETISNRSDLCLQVITVMSINLTFNSKFTRFCQKDLKEQKAIVKDFFSSWVRVLSSNHRGSVLYVCMYVCMYVCINEWHQRDI